MRKYPFHTETDVWSRSFFAILISVLIITGPTFAADRMVLCEAFLLCGV